MYIHMCVYIYVREKVSAHNNQQNLALCCVCCLLLLLLLLSVRLQGKDNDSYEKAWNNNDLVRKRPPHSVYFEGVPQFKTKQ